MIFILKYVSLQSNFWFLVGDRDVGTVAPDLILMMIIVIIMMMVSVMIMMMITIMIMMVVMVVTMMLTMMSPPSWS